MVHSLNKYYTQSISCCFIGNLINDSCKRLKSCTWFTEMSKSQDCTLTQRESDNLHQNNTLQIKYTKAWLSPDYVTSLTTIVQSITYLCCDRTVKPKSTLISLILACTRSFSWQHDTHWATDTLTPGRPLWVNPVSQSVIHTTLRLSRGQRGREQATAAKFHMRHKSMEKNTFVRHI